MEKDIRETLGIQKTDLRKKLKCEDCGVSITSENWAVSKQEWEKDEFGKQIHYCEDCYLKPENL